jgi:hypothetical protein
VSATETRAIHESEVFVVPDTTQDPRFAENPMVVLDPKLRFYAGAPLITDANAKGKWEPFERYVRTHSEAKISHKICPDCVSAISV